MKALIIDSLNSIPERLLPAHREHLIPNSNTELFDLATLVLADTVSNIIYIQIHFPVADILKTFEYPGVQLIKFLRLRLEMRPIIVYSSLQDLETTLRQNHKNAIGFSPGIAFASYKTTSIQFENLDNIIRRKDLIPFFKMEIDLPKDERHNWANWWGMYRLWSVHRFVSYDGKVLEDIKEYQNSVLPQRRRNLEALQVLFLYGHQESEIENEIKILEDLQKESAETLQQLQLEIRHIQENLQINETRGYLIQPLLKRIHVSINLGDWNEVKRLRKEIAEITGSSRSNLKTLKRKKENLNKQLTELELKSKERKEEKDVLDRHLISQVIPIQKFIDAESSHLSSQSLVGLRKTLKSRKPKILYIDDQAFEGWSTLLQMMIYGSPSSEKFSTYAPKPGEDLDQMFEMFDENFFSDVDMVMLDLRLFKEAGTDQISGEYILDRIKRKHAGLPVLLVSATNKSENLETLQALGAEALWTKEGIDSRLDEKGAVRNYLKLLELIEMLTNQQYAGMLSISREIEKLSAFPQKTWWESRLFSAKKVEKESIMNVLKDSFSLLNDCLLIYNLRRSRNYHSDDWFYPALVAHNLRKVVEIIFDYDGTKSKIDRRDGYSQSLNHRCSLASHYLGKRTGDYAPDYTIEKAIELFLEFLGEKYLRRVEMPRQDNQKKLSQKGAETLKKNLEFRERKKRRKNHGK